MSRVPVTIACPECEHDALEHRERVPFAPGAPTCENGETVSPGGLVSPGCKCTVSRTDILLNEILVARLELSRVRTELETAKRDADAKIDTLSREIAAGRRAFLSQRDELDKLSARLSEALS